MYIGFDVYDCGKCTNTAALEIMRVNNVDGECAVCVYRGGFGLNR